VVDRELKPWSSCIENMISISVCASLNVLSKVGLTMRYDDTIGEKDNVVSSYSKKGGIDRQSTHTLLFIRRRREESVCFSSSSAEQRRYRWRETTFRRAVITPPGLLFIETPKSSELCHQRELRRVLIGVDRSFASKGACDGIFVLDFHVERGVASFGSPHYGILHTSPI
jgi:hypothetical protein